MNNTKNNGFLPNNYELPKSTSRYTKFEEWETKVRILSNSLVGWEYFNTENKPVRSRTKFEATPGIKNNAKQKEFWAFVVWNYKTEQIEICEITQASIKNAVWELYKDEDYWDPKGFDLKIKRKWEGLDTEYQVIPAPIREIEKEVKEEYLKENIKLENLLEWTDPFNSSNDFWDLPGDENFE